MKIVLLGAPGSGKGTLSEHLVNKYNFVQLSTGNLFRKVINENLKYAAELKEYLLSGQLVPDELTNKLVKEEIEELEKQKKSIIFDGYPRTLSQASFLDNILNLDKALYLNVDINLICKRLTGRRICSKCGKIYNIYFLNTLKPGICDLDSAPLTQRKDDYEDVINKRIQEYIKLTFPLIDFYRKQNKLYEFNVNEGSQNLIELVDNLFSNIK